MEKTFSKLGGNGYQDTRCQKLDGNGKKPKYDVYRACQACMSRSGLNPKPAGTGRQQLDSGMLEGLSSLALDEEYKSNRTGDSRKCYCEGNIPVDAMRSRLQTILKSCKYSRDCRADAAILECTELCNDRDAQLKKIYDKYNEKHRYDLDVQKAKLLAMSQPKQRPSPCDVKKHPFKVRKSALTYEATPRMLRLAQVNPRNITEKYRPPGVPRYSRQELKARQEKWRKRLHKQRARKLEQQVQKVTKQKKKKHSKVKDEIKAKALDKMYTRLARPKKQFKDPTPEKKPHKPFAEIMKRTRELLAMTKPPEPRIDLDEFFKPKPVPEGYRPSARLLELAMPRKLPSEYLLNQNYEWKITESARNYVPTERILQLAKPKIRKDRVPEVNPYAFKVKKSSLRYKPTQRILELAKPKVYPESD